MSAKRLLPCLALLLGLAANANAQPYGLTETYIPLGCGAAIFGNNTAFPTGVPICSFTMPYAGHLVNMTIQNLTLGGGSCSTAPTFEAYQGATPIAPTQIASAAAQVVGTVTTVTYAQPSPTFAAGVVVGVEVSTAGATCVAPEFSVSLTVAVP